MPEESIFVATREFTTCIDATRPAHVMWRARSPEEAS
jgi:hypothetical protein